VIEFSVQGSGFKVPVPVPVLVRFGSLSRFALFIRAYSGARLEANQNPNQNQNKNQNAEL